MLLLARQASAVMVTFQVDMSQMVINPVGVFLAGDFQGWDPSSTVMTDLGGGIYAMTLDLPPGVYYFKFINGNAWGFDELVPPSCGIDNGGGIYNREVIVTSDVVLPAICFGQCAPCGVASYVMNGNASSMGGDCYQITPANQWQNGAFWSNTQVDLNVDFNLQFEINLGSNDSAGADGVVFVLQRLGSAALGVSGGGMGYSSFGQSLGIEFDTFENLEYNDPAYDHLAIEINGDVDHASPANLAGPIKMSATSVNTEDGLNHTVGIEWEAATQTISVYFDCEFRIQATYDLINWVFGGESLVFWGFTGATGNLMNQQMVCATPVAMQVEQVEICPGSNVMLTAGPSVDNVYSWSPATFLSDVTIVNPISSPDTTMVYEVSYLDLCNVLTTKQITVNVLESGAGCFFLPLELLQFDVEVETNQIDFHWIVESANAQDVFVIERSFDGINFIGVNRISGDDYSSIPGHYTLQCPRTMQNAYYRLTLEVSYQSSQHLSDVYFVEGLDASKLNAVYQERNQSLLITGNSEQQHYSGRIYLADGKLMQTFAMNALPSVVKLDEVISSQRLLVVVIMDAEGRQVYAKKFIVSGN